MPPHATPLSVSNKLKTTVVILANSFSNLSGDHRSALTCHNLKSIKILFFFCLFLFLFILKFESSFKLFQHPSFFFYFNAVFASTQALEIFKIFLSVVEEELVSLQDVLHRHHPHSRHPVDYFHENPAVVLIAAVIDEPAK